jgi:hypothetical protein
MYFEKTIFLLKSDKNKGTLHEYLYNFWLYISHLFLEKNVFRKKLGNKVKTRMLC